jgi:hypothetical protein
MSRVVVRYDNDWKVSTSLHAPIPDSALSQDSRVVVGRTLVAIAGGSFDAPGAGKRA